MVEQHLATAASATRVQQLRTVNFCTSVRSRRHVLGVCLAYPSDDTFHKHSWKRDERPHNGTTAGCCLGRAQLFVSPASHCMHQCNLMVFYIQKIVAVARVHNATHYVRRHMVQSSIRSTSQSGVIHSSSTVSPGRRHAHGKHQIPLAVGDPQRRIRSSVDWREFTQTRQKQIEFIRIRTLAISPSSPAGIYL